MACIEPTFYKHLNHVLQLVSSFKFVLLVITVFQYCLGSRTYFICWQYKLSPSSNFPIFNQDISQPTLYLSYNSTKLCKDYNTIVWAHTSHLSNESLMSGLASTTTYHPPHIPKSNITLKMTESLTNTNTHQQHIYCDTGMRYINLQAISLCECIEMVSMRKESCWVQEC